MIRSFALLLELFQQGANVFPAAHSDDDGEAGKNGEADTKDPSPNCNLHFHFSPRYFAVDRGKVLSPGTWR
jgi:hypothetical protein